MVFFESQHCSQLGFATAAIGISTGLGAQLGRSFGTPRQLRFIVFGTLLAFVGVEALVYGQTATGDHTFAVHLLADPTWLCSGSPFFICGIIFGVRLLVGSDPLSTFSSTGMSSPPAELLVHPVILSARSTTFIRVLLSATGMWPSVARTLAGLLTFRLNES